LSCLLRTASPWASFRFLIVNTSVLLNPKILSTGLESIQRISFRRNFRTKLVTYKFVDTSLNDNLVPVKLKNSSTIVRSICLLCLDEI
jgi:hypothetical protein